MVSGASEPIDRIVGLEIGADDYLTKPFDPRELLARIKSVLRRYQRRAAAETPAAPSGVAPRRMAFGRCVLDLDSRELFRPDGEPIPLTAAEFDLLQVFAERPNRTLSRDQLLGLTQNRDWDPYDRSIDIRIARLRKKIEANPDKPRTIKTVRGVGYLFVPGKTIQNADAAPFLLSSMPGKFQLFRAHGRSEVPSATSASSCPDKGG
jgi:two-component system phosphate regulon response regulator OmpR